MEIDKYGTKKWRLPNGNYHREDGPAIECKNGDKYWWLNDKRHRENGPAVEWANGDKWWWLNGKRHREDDPAVEYTNGDKHWYLNNRIYKIQTKNKIVERDKNFDCKTCVSQIVCDEDCQEDIIWKEYYEK